MISKKNLFFLYFLFLWLKYFSIFYYKVYNLFYLFLFTFYKENRIHVYNASGINEHYLYADDKQIAFGCSDNYFSLTLENDFYEGYSKPTQTYKNPVLNSKDKFIIIKLEVWGFQDK